MGVRGVGTRGGGGIGWGRSCTQESRAGLVTRTDGKVISTDDFRVDIGLGWVTGKEGELDRIKIGYPGGFS